MNYNNQTKKGSNSNEFASFSIAIQDGFLWKGFRGPAQRVAESFSGIGHVDAAFRMHREGRTEDHDHVYLFQVGWTGRNQRELSYR